MGWVCLVSCGDLDVSCVVCLRVLLVDLSWFELLAFLLIVGLLMVLRRAGFCVCLVWCDSGGGCGPDGYDLG